MWNQKSQSEENQIRRKNKQKSRSNDESNSLLWRGSCCCAMWKRRSSRSWSHRRVDSTLQESIRKGELIKQISVLMNFSALSCFSLSPPPGLDFAIIPKTISAVLLTIRLSMTSWLRFNLEKSFVFLSFRFMSRGEQVNCGDGRQMVSDVNINKFWLCF